MGALSAFSIFLDICLIHIEKILSSLAYLGTHFLVNPWLLQVDEPGWFVSSHQTSG